jgi:hypothetical protein
MSLPHFSEESGLPYVLRENNHGRDKAGFLFTWAHSRIVFSFSTARKSFVPIGSEDRATVRNGTASPPSRCHKGCMLHRKTKKEPGNATRASDRKEMAKPRITRSARVAELNLDTARIPEQPSATMPGTVDKLIPSPGPSQPKKAQIAVDGADHGHRNLRIENALTDEHGDDVKLKKGAHVEVTVTAEPKTPTAAIDKGS